MDSTPIYQYAKPMSASVKPPKSSEPIQALGYEPRPRFIKLIRDQFFSGEGNENPYSHLKSLNKPVLACILLACLTKP